MNQADSHKVKNLGFYVFLSYMKYTFEAYRCDV